MKMQNVISWLNQHVARTAHLCLDSRQIAPGDVFFACPGRAGDGRAYIAQALEHGAAAVVMQADPTAAESHVQKEGPDPNRVPVLQVENLTSRLGMIANEWYGEPSKALSVVAVTGTNGKTTTVQWVAAALASEDVACGAIGTLGVTMPDGSRLDAGLTTPDVLTMHRNLAAMRDAGATVVALEASSIGIEQGRLDHVHIDVAAFTNLTRDHLDYHHTVERYKQAKCALFKWLGLRSAVINVDDPTGAELLAGISGVKTLACSLGRDESAAVQAHDIHTGSNGVIFNLVTPQGTAQLLTRLVGEHNVSNVLLVAGVLLELGWSISRIARMLSILRSVEGRLQIVEPDDIGKGGHGLPLVVVDYAHTPDALARALAALREVAAARRGALVCVFGCGGDRDSGKRPIMGGIAAEQADRVFITNDNPRSENPQSIIDEIVAGMTVAPVIEPDRARAILSALWSADANDVVLLAGKGHETYQEFNRVRQPFDDREWARFALSWLGTPDLSTDSRHIGQDQIFLALKGDVFDGHDYLAQAQQAGARAAVVAEKDGSVALTQFALGDTRAALIRIASAWRRLFDLPVIGVTGSNGKTTTKEMIASILRAWHGDDAHLATQGNLNNDIGVPLTVLRLARRHRAAVIELGMNHPGEIAVLAAVAGPTIGLVNNAQREHQEFMRTVQAVAEENGAVILALPDDGVAVFPGDDAYTDLWVGMAGRRRVVRFGFDPGFDVYADGIYAEPTRTTCQLHTPVGDAALVLSAPGVHNLRNALAAAACALAAGAPLTAIVQGLQEFNPVAGRMEPRPLPGGYQLIDDTYNANPDSVRAAVDVLASLSGKRVLVLGDMGEVGDDGDAMHAEVGAYAKERGVDALLTLGRASARAAAAFGADARAFDSIDALNEELLTLTPANVLVKGSRSTRMERVVQALEEKLNINEEGARHAT